MALLSRNIFHLVNVLTVIQSNVGLMAVGLRFFQANLLVISELSWKAGLRRLILNFQLPMEYV